MRNWIIEVRSEIHFMTSSHFDFQLPTSNFSLQINDQESAMVSKGGIFKN